MAEEQKNTLPEDEYQFPQEEYIAGGTGAQATPPGGEEQPPVQKPGEGKISGLLSNFTPFLQRNKRIVIVVIVVFILFLLLHFSIGHKKPIPLPAATPVVEQPQSDDTAMLGSLASLRQHTSKTTTDIRDLQSQVSNLQNAINQTQSDNAQLRSAIGALSDQMKGISTQLEKIMAEGKSLKKGSKITYHLRAIIPDRGWIASDTGETISITMGDQLKSYGKVTAIHPEQGVIETSSGRKIVYGPNDR